MDGYALIRWSPNFPWIHSHHGRLGRQQQRLPQRHRLRHRRHPLLHRRQQHQRWRKRCQELGQVMVSKMISWNLVDYFPYGVAPAVFWEDKTPRWFPAIEPICASQEEEFWFWSNEVPEAVRMMAQSGQISRCQIGWSMKIYIYIYHTLKRQWDLFLNICLKTYCM